MFQLAIELRLQLLQLRDRQRSKINCRGVRQTVMGLCSIETYSGQIASVLALSPWWVVVVCGKRRGCPARNFRGGGELGFCRSGRRELGRAFLRNTAYTILIFPMLGRRRALQVARSSRSFSQSSRFTPVKRFDGTLADVKSLDLSVPTIFPRHFTDLPAIGKWFTPVDSNPGRGVRYNPNISYLGRHGSLMVPLELTRYNSVEVGVDNPRSISSFECMQAPLSLLLSHISSKDFSQQLYLAQCSLDDLPSELQDDLPVPEVIPHLGRGDVYASSLWMGRPPTSTPLHRDPNPNLFVQLVGEKAIRLMKPKHGRLLYERLRTEQGHAHMRGEEMMVGEERNRLQDVIWNEKESNGVSASGLEANLEGGDGLYIPLGWWHAVESVGTNANASVNWWFR